MRKIILGVMIALMLSVMVVSAKNILTQPSEWVTEPGQQSGNQQMNRAETANQLQQMIQEKQQQMEMERQQMGETERHIYQNQNQVRETVHALLASEGLMGGIGPQVSEIATQFDNSVEKTIDAETKIMSRSKFARFFLGGDKDAAKRLMDESATNMQRLQQLEQLMEQCGGECDPEAKQMLQEQIQNMYQEQERIQNLAQSERKSMGLLGWLFNRGEED